MLILEHPVYSVISPEGANSVLWRGARTSADAASAMKVTAQDLLGLNIVDRVVPEPPGGAHANANATIRLVGDTLEEELRGLEGLGAEELRQQRRDRFLRYRPPGAELTCLTSRPSRDGRAHRDI